MGAGADLKQHQLDNVLPDQEQQAIQQGVCWCRQLPHQVWLQFDEEGWVDPATEIGWCQQCHVAEHLNIQSQWVYVICVGKLKHMATICHDKPAGLAEVWIW